MSPEPEPGPTLRVGNKEHLRYSIVIGNIMFFLISPKMMFQFNMAIYCNTRLPGSFSGIENDIGLAALLSPALEKVTGM